MDYPSRVIARAEPEAPGTRQWMSTLRNHAPASVYSIDPFVEVFNLRDSVFSLFAESADGMGDTWHHLIVGPQKALLIDTGFGIGNLLGLVNMITGGKPLFVAVTHEHLDHVYGNCQFDEVHCHECGASIVRQSMNAHVWDHLYDLEGKGTWLRFDKQDIIPYKEYHIVACPDGHVFDLGNGHLVEMVHVPGHAPGGASYIDTRNRILFTGAFHSNYVTVGCNPKKRAEHPFGELATVSAFLTGLRKLHERRSQYDRIFPAHEILDIEKMMVSDMIRLCEAVIEDPDSHDGSVVNKRGMNVKYKALGLGSIRYIDQSVC